MREERKGSRSGADNWLQEGEGSSNFRASLPEDLCVIELSFPSFFC